MAISRKPKGKKVNVEALIRKGGSVPLKRRSEPVPVILRIPPDLLQQLDEYLSRRHLKKPRHTYILESLAKCLEDDLR